MCRTGGPGAGDVGGESPQEGKKLRVCTLRYRPGHSPACGDGESDPLFQQEKFRCALAIFANNDVKYEVYKIRAQCFGNVVGKGVTWAVARDMPSQETLRANPEVKGRRLQWLNKHDKDCGNLYGMLPLVENMPLFLTEQLGRGPKNYFVEKMLAAFLGGRRGRGRSAR